MALENNTEKFRHTHISNRNLRYSDWRKHNFDQWTNETT